MADVQEHIDTTHGEAQEHSDKQPDGESSLLRRPVSASTRSDYYPMVPAMSPRFLLLQTGCPTGSHDAQSVIVKYVSQLKSATTTTAIIS